MSQIIRVALATPLRKLFDYLPLLSAPLPLPGARVRVPFGTKERIGVVAEIADHSDHPPNKLKCILECLDPEPLFSETILELIHWTSRYYHTSLGEVFDTALPSWLRKGKAIVEIKRSEPKHPLIPHPLTLNVYQEKAISEITRCLNTFVVHVLEGVTGSGKTEVYLGIMEKVLANHQQVLILVPEIGLTPQLIERVSARFHVPIAVLHSSISEKKRAEAFEMARQGIAPIVIGTRSAAFTPLKSPGLFIIDEEHDVSFKQHEGLRYSARDLLIKRATLEKCPIVLGSATPSLETLHNVLQERYQCLKLPERAKNTHPLSLQLLDIRHKKLEEGLSLALIEKMKLHLKNQGQILLFLNRRGFAPVLMCFDCGWIASCKNCDARLTLHAKKKLLRCHHCESQKPLPLQCDSCSSESLNPLGIGTERLEKVLTQHFPNEIITRIDRDTTHRKGSLQAAFDDIKTGRSNILIGTQMIAKGHDFPNITLVAIVDADNALFSVDFRSLERLGQLLTQVAGRAGRAEKKGEVVLQTCHPNHPLLHLLLEKGYRPFAESLLAERKLATLPPYTYQILLRASASKKERPYDFLNKLKTLLRTSAIASPENVQVLGPLSAPMEKKQGFYRAQLLVQSHQRSLLQKIMTTVIQNMENEPLSRLVRWSVDVDPAEMYN